MPKSKAKPRVERQAEPRRGTQGISAASKPPQRQQASGLQGESNQPEQGAVCNEPRVAANQERDEHGQYSGTGPAGQLKPGGKPCDGARE